MRHKTGKVVAGLRKYRLYRKLDNKLRREASEYTLNSIGWDWRFGPGVSIALPAWIGTILGILADSLFLVLFGAALLCLAIVLEEATVAVGCRHKGWKYHFFDFIEV